MPELQNPVVVIPGITGTSLYDDYPLVSEPLWTAVLHAEHERLSLHPDDLRYEATEPALVRARALLGIAYNDLIDALRHDLASRSDRPVPVFSFPYDWRQDVWETGAQLAVFVEEVVARTKLLRHYKDYDNVRNVDIVAHSMGGLLACEYLARSQTGRRVGKIATIGTPFLGSLEALVKLLTGLGSVSGGTPKERDREAARAMPAVYQLLPSFPGAIVPSEPDSASAPETDMFQVGAWQPGVLESLAEYIRLSAVDPGNAQTRADRAAGLLGELLNRAKEHRNRVNSLDLGHLGMDSQDWLAIVGVGAKTRVRAKVALVRGKPRYVITEDDRLDDGGDTGDSTVPLLSAVPPFLRRENVVAVRPDDFDFWELGDRALAANSGFHAALPTMNLVHRLVLKHLRGGHYSGVVHGRPAPGVDPADWRPPIPGLKLPSTRD